MGQDGLALSMQAMECHRIARKSMIEERHWALHSGDDRIKQLILSGGNHNTVANSIWNVFQAT